MALNFLAPEVRRRRLLGRALLGVSLTAALSLVLQVETIRGMSSERDRLAAEIRGLGNEANRLKNVPLGQGTLDEKLARGVLDEVSAVRPFSWTGLLVALEETLPKGAALTRIQAQGKEGTVVLSGRARDASVPSSLVESLDRHGSFSSPRLLKIAPPEEDGAAPSPVGDAKQRGRKGKAGPRPAGGADGALFEIEVRYMGPAPVRTDGSGAGDPRRGTVTGAGKGA